MFRAEVVGSMLRPGYLKHARAEFQAGRMPVSHFKQIEDRAVDQVIATQEGSGVEVVTDGEMRRFLFMGPITETVAGIELVERGTAMPWASPEGETEWSSPAAVTSKLEKKRSMVCEEYSYARARARLPLKVTVPSPLVLYGFWNTEYSTAAYKDPFAMFADAAEVGRSEIQELVSLGCSYIQVDAPELATLVDPRVRDWAQAQGMPAERMLTEGIDLINDMVAGVSGARLAIHLCRGNNAGMWMATGGYDYIAERAVCARDRVRRVPARVRRSAVGHVRAVGAGSRRQAGGPRARLDQERPRARRSPRSRRGSTRRRGRSRASSSASRRSAALRRSPTATRSQSRRRSGSCDLWLRRRAQPGARHQAPLEHDPASARRRGGHVA